MKKTLHTLFVLSLATLASVNGAFANVVTPQAAQTVAINFFKANASTRGAATASLKFTKTESDGTVDFYVFDIAPRGFVIVAADDNIQPVIGYSLESNFNNNFIKSGVADWMGHAGTHIYTAIQQHITANARITNQWNNYSTGVNPTSAKSLNATAVAPMLTTMWDQEPYYNQYAPYNSVDSQRCMAGCVATAMAQIMKYWNFPAQGTGQYSYMNGTPMFRHNYGNQSANFGGTTYNWNNMPDSLTGNNADVATLMYHCAVSVAMDFGDDNQGGSGAYVLKNDVASWQHSAQSSYVNYFGYNNNTLRGVYQADYTSADWLALIKSELNEGRPVQYQGEDLVRGGHTWVCDGYDANDMLHMNWGWSGVDNGYFSVSSLCASGMNFSNNEEALVGLEPTVNVSLSIKGGRTNICSGDSAGLLAMGSPNATYTWLPSTGLSCPTCALTMASPAVTTMYTVNIDSNGFKASKSVLVTVRANVEVTGVSSTNVTCFGASNGAAEVSAIGGTSSLNYLWSNGQDSSSSVSNLSAGSYSLTVSDASGCSASSFFSVSQPNSISISLVTYQTVHTLVYGGIEANVTGGAENFSYLWNTKETTSIITTTAVGDYTLTVTDNNGCTQSATATINPTATTTNPLTLGVNEVNAAASFNVYPNPTKGEVTVELENVTNGATLSVKNLLGQVLLTKTVSDFQNKFDLSQFAEGAYFIHLQAGETSFVKQVIVKK